MVRSLNSNKEQPHSHTLAAFKEMVELSSDRWRELHWLHEFSGWEDILSSIQTLDSLDTFVARRDDVPAGLVKVLVRCRPPLRNITATTKTPASLAVLLELLSTCPDMQSAHVSDNGPFEVEPCCTSTLLPPPQNGLFLHRSAALFNTPTTWATNLKALTLVNAIGPSSFPIPDLVHLPSLETLTLSHHYIRQGHILWSLDIPKLYTLHYHQCDLGDFFESSWLGEERDIDCFPPPKRLVLSGTDVESGVLLRFLVREKVEEVDLVECQCKCGWEVVYGLVDYYNALVLTRGDAEFKGDVVVVPSLRRLRVTVRVGGGLDEEVQEAMEDLVEIRRELDHPLEECTLFWA